MVTEWLSCHSRDKAPISCNDLFADEFYETLQLMQYEVTVNASEDKSYSLVAEMNAEAIAEREKKRSIALKTQTILPRFRHMETKI